MDKETLAKEINRWQEKLVSLVTLKKKSLNDPEVYWCSCVIDKLVVEYMKKVY